MKKRRTQQTGSKAPASRKNAVRRIVVGSVGGLTLSAGIAMIVLPGPAFVFIPLGLGILSTEFKWARRTLEAGVDSLKRWASGREQSKHGRKATRKEKIT